FAEAVRRLNEESERYRKVRRRVDSVINTRLPLPVPRFHKKAKVIIKKMKEPWRPPSPLAEAARQPDETAENVTFTAAGQRIEVCGASFIVLEDLAPALEIVMAALLLKHLKEREGVDALALLEEKLGSPGLLTPLKETLERLLSLLEADPELRPLFSEE
ncbi:MAG: hypothetical protein QXJ59_08525, partial [Thermofilaceae archaeon]